MFYIAYIDSSHHLLGRFPGDRLARFPSLGSVVVLKILLTNRGEKDVTRALGDEGGAHLMLLLPLFMFFLKTPPPPLLMEKGGFSPSISSKNRC